MKQLYLPIAIALTPMIAPLTIFADAPQPSMATSIRLEAPSHTFALELTALYLKPSSSNLSYAAEAAPLPIITPQWKIHEIEPNYHMGFMVGLGGVFHESNTSLKASWEHFDSKDSASVTAVAGSMVGPFFEIGPDAKIYSIANGTSTIHFDTISLNYGSFIQFGNRSQVNFSAGVNGSRIHQTLFSQYTNSDGNTDRKISTPTFYIGAGPELRMDFSSRIVKGLHFTGSASAALLVGNQKNTTYYTAYSPLLNLPETQLLGSDNPNRQRTRDKITTQVVPAFTGKLGLSYEFNSSKTCQVTLEVGYQAEVYLDALQSIDMGSEVTNPSNIENLLSEGVGVYARTFKRSLSNFALSGAYLNLKLAF